MLVPLDAAVPQLFVVTLKSFAAETTLTPGAMTSGLIRPSATGPRDEKLATDPAEKSWFVAPTARTFFPVAGLATVAEVPPLFPAAKTSRKSGWDHMNASASCEPSE